MADQKDITKPLLAVDSPSKSDEDGDIELPHVTEGRLEKSDSLPRSPAVDPSQQASLPRVSSTTRRNDASMLLRRRAMSEEPTEPVHIDHSIESLDCEEQNSSLLQNHLQTCTEASLASVEIARWVLSFVIGVFSAFFAFFVMVVSSILSKSKMDLVRTQLDNDNIPGAFAIFSTFNAFLVLVACAITVFIAPTAAKSGIIEVRAWLNGVKLSKAVRAVTLAVKTLGISLVTAGNICVGREGPMIHICAMLAAGLSQGKSSSMGFDTSWSKFKAFRTDKEKRDFIATGASSGVATGEWCILSRSLSCLCFLSLCLSQPVYVFL